MPCAGTSGAERTTREKKGADHRPSAWRWPGCVRRGAGGTSNCTNGLDNGPATAKSAQMDLARGGFFATTQTQTASPLVGGQASQWSVWWVGARESGCQGRGCTGRSFRFTRLLGDDRRNYTSERPRVSALSDAAHRDARAPRPALTHPTTRPVTYLDVPSLLERTASARCRLPVHVDKPPVLSEARRWVL